MENIGKTVVLLPMDDVTAIYTAEYADELSKKARISRPAPGLPALLADKQELAALCARLDIPHPSTRVVTSEADRDQAARDYGFPMMAKWARPWQAAEVPGLRSTTLVRSPAELLQIQQAGARHGIDLLLQRYIPPTPHGDWFFHAYFTPESGCAFSATGRKDRAYPASAGITTLGRWLPNPTIERLGRTLAETLGFAGILDLDFRLDPRDGKHYLLDFNPRVGAQFRLFNDSSDLDVIRAAYLDLTGQAVTAGRPAYGRTYLVENYDLLRKLGTGNGRTGRDGSGWLASIRHSDELAWFAKDDVAPFTGMMRSSFLRALNFHRIQLSSRKNM